MPRIKMEDRFYNNSDIGTFLRNAVLVCQRPESGNIRVSKFPRLREFSEALIEPFREMAEEGAITPEELRFVLSAALLMFHQVYCAKESVK
jgi:hypothetical protein